MRQSAIAALIGSVLVSPALAHDIAPPFLTQVNAAPSDAYAVTIITDRRIEMICVTCLGGVNILLTLGGDLFVDREVVDILVGNLPVSVREEAFPDPCDVTLEAREGPVIFRLEQPRPSGNTTLLSVAHGDRLITVDATGADEATVRRDAEATLDNVLTALRAAHP